MTFDRHGPRYSPELDSLEIVELMRIEIDEYQAANVIPDDLVIDVWLGTAGDIDSIDIVIKDAGTCRVFLDSYLESLDCWPPEAEMYTQKFRVFLAHLRSIQRKWQRATGQGAVDLFSNNYRGQVRLDYDTYVQLCNTEGVRK